MKQKHAGPKKPCDIQWPPSYYHQSYIPLHGRTVAQAVSRQLPTARVRDRVRSCRSCGGQSGTGVGFLRVLSFPCQFSFHRMLHIHHHLSSGVGTVGQFVADVPNGLSLTPINIIIKSNNISWRQRAYCDGHVVCSQNMHMEKQFPATISTQ
jgi:hypothetical protein